VATARSSSGALTSLRAAAGGVTALKGAVRGLRAAVAGESAAALRDAGALVAAFSSSAAAVVARAQRSVAGVVEGLKGELAELFERHKRECAERRRLFNLVQELRGNIRVYARVRPTSAAELAGGGDSVAVTFPVEEGALAIVNSKRAAKAYEFDAVFKPGTPNAAVYREVEGIVLSALDGYNTCIFAYGQTGSGKTYTMEGTPESRGINYCALGTLFDVAAARERDGWAWEFTVALLEIYNEEIRDMLAEKGADGLPLSKGKLKARESPTGMEVPGLVMERVATAEEVSPPSPQCTPLLWRS
jgi:kinesin family protein C2/C3